MEENRQELTKDVDRARELEADIPQLKTKLQQEERELNRLKPEINKLQSEKIKIHREFQQMEEEGRREINEHLTDKSKMIKPSNN